MVDAIPRHDPDRPTGFRPPELPLLVFTDLDGTLLDHHSYSFSAALPALERLRKAGVPVIPVTSKTLAELAPLMRELDNAHPCIAENGGLIALPPGYFTALDDYPLQEGYRVIELSPGYENILQTARRLRAEYQYQFRGFSDMSDAEVAGCTGLSAAEAARARRRLCSEPLLWLDTAAAFAQFRQALQAAGLQLVQGGRFWHLMANHDKASAMQRLCEQYRAAGFQDFKTVALGDSPNDVPMLEAVDTPILIRRPDGGCLSLQTDQPAPCSELPGPAGWNQMMLQLLDAASAGELQPHQLAGETQHG
jgi:mannosyl-3-phosphoglycerate phosphatase